MELNFDIPKVKSSIIKVIGVGGGGGNAVNHMFRQGIQGVDFIVCNTDSQALDKSPVPHKVQIGSNLTEGRGAGSNPEVGKKAAVENIEQIKKLLASDTKMVFITAGMGGGTGTGAAPIIANTAKDMGILTVGIVTTPFKFEGRVRGSRAEEGIVELGKAVDTLLVISNEKLRAMYGNLSLSNAFSNADNILTTAAKGISEIITVPGYVNVDFEDVRTVMTNSGEAIMGSAIAEGEDRAQKAIEAAIHSPLLSDEDIRGAKYILLNICSGTKEVLMDEISIITDYIREEANNETGEVDMIWGNSTDEELGEKLSVTVIATSFDKSKREKKTELEEQANKPLAKAPDNEKIADDAVVASVPSADVKPDSNKDKATTESSPTTAASAENSSQEPPKAAGSKTKHQLNEDEVRVETDEDNGFQDQNEALAKAEKQEEAASYKSTASSVYRVTEGQHQRIKTSDGLSELESVPAYKRRNIKLEEVKHSSSVNVSRFSLTESEEDKPMIRKNNAYLHNNID